MSVGSRAEAAAGAAGPGELLGRYLRLTREALAVVRPGPPERSFLRAALDQKRGEIRQAFEDAARGLATGRGSRAA